MSDSQEFVEVTPKELRAFTYQQRSDGTTCLSVDGNPVENGFYSIKMGDKDFIVLVRGTLAIAPQPETRVADFLNNILSSRLTLQHPGSVRTQP